MNSNILEKTLELIGVSELATKLYIYLLENSKQSITDIAKHFNIHRNYIYVALEELERFDLASYEKKYAKNIVLEAPDKVLSLLEIKKNSYEAGYKDFMEVLPNYLQNFYSDSKNQTIRVYKGKIDFIAFFHKIYTKPNQETLFLGNNDLFIDVFSRSIFDSFLKRRVENKTKSRILTTRPAIYLEKNKHKDQEEYREFRYLPKDYDFAGSFQIIGNTFISYNPLIPNAVVIEDGVAAQMYRNLFEFIWVKSSSSQQI